MIALNARVIRNGVECMIPATELVPGDIIIFSIEDCIPVDLRVIELPNMTCQETALTGESVPFDKSTDIIEVLADKNHEHIPIRDCKNRCFSATLVTQGSG